MEWYNILTIVIGAFGGITGIISLYNAKPNRTKIEVDVLNKVIDRLDAELANKEKAFQAYKEEVYTRVAEVKREVAADRAENAKFRMAFYQAYRCKFPENIHDCPVIAALEVDEDNTCGSCQSGHINQSKGGNHD